MDIELNVINHSNDVNNSEIIIFQKNVSESFDESAIAWKVIQNLGHGWNHPLRYTELTVSARDSYGNYTPQYPAIYGQSFAMIRDNSGEMLRLSSEPSKSPKEIEVKNQLETGEISAGISRSGSLLAQVDSIAPGQEAVFEFKPTIWIGVSSQIKEGQVMNPAVLSNINTEISLLGIASTDIIMTGGGPGPDSRPFEFTVQNTVMA